VMPIEAQPLKTTTATSPPSPAIRFKLIHLSLITIRRKTEP
jgi:hypothetical protein